MSLPFLVVSADHALGSSRQSDDRLSPRFRVMLPPGGRATLSPTRNHSTSAESSRDLTLEVVIELDGEVKELKKEITDLRKTTDKIYDSIATNIGGLLERIANSVSEINQRGSKRQTDDDSADAEPQSKRGRVNAPILQDQQVQRNDSLIGGLSTKTPQVQQPQSSAVPHGQPREQQSNTSSQGQLTASTQTTSGNLSFGDNTQRQSLVKTQSQPARSSNVGLSPPVDNSWSQPQLGLLSPHPGAYSYPHVGAILSGRIGQSFVVSPFEPFSGAVIPSQYGTNQVSGPSQPSYPQTQTQMQSTPNQNLQVGPQGPSSQINASRPPQNPMPPQDGHHSSL
jgi:hypothetical protein